MSRRAEFACRSNVCRTRGRVAGWMVVSYGEGSAVMPKHRVENLSDRQEGAVDAALADRDDLPRLVGGVTDEHDDALARRALELANRDRSHIGRRRQPRGTGLALNKSGQAERRRKCGRLSGSQAGESGQFVGPCSRDPRDASELPRQSARSRQTALPSPAGLQDERDKLFDAERVESRTVQPLDRGVEGFFGLQWGKREGGCVAEVRRVCANSAPTTPESIARGLNAPLTATIGARLGRWGRRRG